MHKRNIPVKWLIEAKTSHIAYKVLKYKKIKAKQSLIGTISIFIALQGCNILNLNRSNILLIHNINPGGNTSIDQRYVAIKQQ